MSSSSSSVPSSRATQNIQNANSCNGGEFFTRQSVRVWAGTTVLVAVVKRNGSHPGPEGALTSIAPSKSSYWTQVYCVLPNLRVKDAYFFCTNNLQWQARAEGQEEPEGDGYPDVGGWLYIRVRLVFVFIIFIESHWLLFSVPTLKLLVPYRALVLFPNTTPWAQWDSSHSLTQAYHGHPYFREDGRSHVPHLIVCGDSWPSTMANPWWGLLEIRRCVVRVVTEVSGCRARTINFHEPTHEGQEPAHKQSQRLHKPHSAGEPTSEPHEPVNHTNQWTSQTSEPHEHEPVTHTNTVA